MTTKNEPNKALKPADMSLLKQTYEYNVYVVRDLGMPIGTPFLPAVRKHKRARELAAKGFLEIKNEATGGGESWPCVCITTSGIDAYNMALKEKLGE